MPPPTQNAVYWCNQSGQDANGVSVPAQDIAGTTITIEFWYLTTVTTFGAHFVYKRVGSTTGYAVQQDNTFRPQFLYGNGITQVSTTSGGINWNDGTWHHFAVVRNGTAYTYYQNGSVVASGTVTSNAIAASGADIRLGGTTPTNNKFFGLLCEVRVWNVARTQAQIQALMNELAQGNESGLVACYHCGEGTGAVIEDATGNRDLTLTLPAWVNNNFPPFITVGHSRPTTPTDLSSLQATLEAAIAAIGTGETGTLTMTHQEDTTGPAQIAHAGAMYKVDVTAFGTNEGQDATPFGTYLPDIGRVAFLAAGGAVTETRVLRYGLHELWPAHSPAAGLWLKVKPGVECHVEAWEYV